MRRLQIAARRPAAHRVIRVAAMPLPRAVVREAPLWRVHLRAAPSLLATLLQLHRKTRPPNVETLDAGTMSWRVERAGTIKSRISSARSGFFYRSASLRLRKGARKTWP